MNISLQKGKYVVAVSGGVDSVVLLHVLSKIQDPRSEVSLVVAHFDHGIREDSANDTLLVENMAKSYNLRFVTERAELGANASEDQARNARYEFLRRVCADEQATAIITAHHQDDLVETIILQLKRGSGRWGLSPMLRTSDIMRPFLNLTKAEIIRYAKKHNLHWHEDSTNASIDYARNALRQKLASTMTDNSRQKLLTIYSTMCQKNTEIDELVVEVTNAVAMGDDEIKRSLFVQLPYNIGAEVVIVWLKRNGVSMVDKKMINRLVIACKTLEIGKKIDINGSCWLYSDKTSLKILRK